ncbi:MAG: hypothetical protein KatS3mg105_4516 [Gemmatales bacterium]|nr:MAG: hypothetical protein KatS3mg105_4516 [Gemmatales bacterium]
MLRKVFWPGTLAAVLAWATSEAKAADFNVNDQTSFFNALQTIAGTPNQNDTINITGSFTMTGVVPSIAKGAGFSLTINGNGFTIDGGNQFRPFFVHQGQVDINNLTIANARAKGGDGGGGGLGAGGGLFVDQFGQVSLLNVNFLNTSAVGGNGGALLFGGGGLGGNGGGSGAAGGGGGGGGLYGNGGSGIAPASGGGGGGGEIANGGNGGSGGAAGGGGGGGRFGNGGDGAANGGGGGGGGLTANGGNASGATGGAGGGLEGGNGGDNGTNDGFDGATFGGGGGGGSLGNGGNGGKYGGGGGGGGGGNGGNGGYFGGGGGGGNGGANGLNGGDFGGGGGAGVIAGGSGGFGGGGGGGGANGGNGGFGGGGGGGVNAGGTGGQFAGNGGTTGGGGGAALGGAIFVRQGGVLVIRGGTITGGSVTAGLGAGNGQNGQALASGIFLHNVNLVYDTPGTATMNDDIAGIGSAQVTVNGGKLLMNGTGTVPFVVNPNGTLGGTGTVGNTTVTGTIAPGNSIGTINVAGNFVQNGGVYEVELNAAGQSDLINVTGTATINGGTVNVLAAPGTYSVGQQYTILTAAGGVTGNYSGVTDNLALFNFLVFTDSNNVFLRLVTSFQDVAGTLNQREVARAFDSTGTTASGDLATVINAFQPLSAAQARSAFDQMSGEIHGSIASVTLEKESLFLRTVARRLRAPIDTTGAQMPVLAQNTSAPANNNSSIQQVAYRTQSPDDENLFLLYPAQQTSTEAWFTQYGLTADAQGDGNAQRIGYNIGGLAVGFDRWLGQNTIIGLVGGYSYFNVNTNILQDRANVSSYNLAVYGRQYLGNGWITGIGSYSYDDYNTRRQIAFGTINRTAHSQAFGHEGSTYWEAGYSFNLPRLSIQPIAGMQYIHVWRSDFAESGADSINLLVAPADVDSLRTLLGGRIIYPIQTQSGLQVVPEFRSFWMHEYLNDNRLVNAQFAGILNNPIATRGINLGEDFAMLGLGLSAQVTRRISFGVHYDAYLSNAQSAHAGIGQLMVQW